MRKTKLLCCTILSAVFSIGSLFAQSAQYATNRLNYATQVYKLDTSQAKSYVALLQELDESLLAIDKQVLSTKARLSAIKNTKASLRKSARSLLLPDQFQQWVKNHNLDLKTRFYKEDLAMTAEQYTAFASATKKYSQDNAAVYRKQISVTNKQKAVDENLVILKTSLSQVFDEDMVAFLLKDIFVQNSSHIFSKNYTTLTSHKAKQLASLQYDYKLKGEEIKTSSLAQKEKVKAWKKLSSDHDKDLKNLLNEDQYYTFSKLVNARDDHSKIKSYGITAEQYKSYKKLSKRYALSLYTISKTKGEKSEKEAKRTEATEKYKDDVKQLFGAAQFEKWKIDFIAQNKH